MISHCPPCKDVDLLCRHTFHLKSYLVSRLPGFAVDLVSAADEFVCGHCVPKAIVTYRLSDAHVDLNEDIQCLRQAHQIWCGKDASPHSSVSFVDAKVVDVAIPRGVALVKWLVVVHVAMWR